MSSTLAASDSFGPIARISSALGYDDAERALSTGARFEEVLAEAARAAAALPVSEEVDSQAFLSTPCVIASAPPTRRAPVARAA